MTCMYADWLGRAEPLFPTQRAKTRAAFGVLLLVLLVSGPATAFAQEGVPGARLPSGADHRAALRAEAYRSVARFFAEWREAWNSGNAQALARLYTEDATVRLPGQALMRGKGPIETTLRAALASGARLSMSDVDFDSDGERSILVSRYILRREGHVVEGVMTAAMYGYRSRWRLRVQIFDAPETAATTPGTVSAVTPLVLPGGGPAASTPAQQPWPAPLRRRATTRLEFERLSMVDVDFDGNGEWSILVARSVLSREGHLVEGIMTAVMYGHGSGWRLRAHIFDAPEKVTTPPDAVLGLRYERPHASPHSGF
jgi:ketosteroid isomerase-like protein